MGISDRCAVWGCDNGCQYSDCYVINPHVPKWDQSLQLWFFSPKNENEVKTWTKLVNRVFVESSAKKKTLRVSKHTKICSNHFEYGRPVEAALQTLPISSRVITIMPRLVLKENLQLQEKSHQLQRKY